jgi:hypothetical protein
MIPQGARFLTESSTHNGSRILELAHEPLLPDSIRITVGSVRCFELIRCRFCFGSLPAAEGRERPAGSHRAAAGGGVVPALFEFFLDRLIWHLARK